MVGFSKYEFNNKLLGGVTFFRMLFSGDHFEVESAIIFLWVKFIRK